MSSHKWLWNKPKGSLKECSPHRLGVERQLDYV